MSREQTEGYPVESYIQPQGPGFEACICTCGCERTRDMADNRRVVAKWGHKNQEFVSVELASLPRSSTNTR